MCRKSIVAMRNGIATVLAGAGFTAGGVFQIPFAPRSWFTYSQSSGVMGSNVANCGEE